MTAEQVQIRRDTAANLNAATPASGELGWDTTNTRLVGGNGVRAGGFQIPNFNDLQRNVFTLGVVGGTGNAITLTHTPASLSDTGLSGSFVATANNTGAITIAVDGRSAAAGKKLSAGVITDLESGDIVTGGYYNWARVGSIYLITTGITPAPSTSGWELLSIATGGGSTYDFTSGIDANYRNYAFILENVLPAVAAGTLALRTRRSGQGSFDTGSSDYLRIRHGSGSIASGASSLMELTSNSFTPADAGISGIVYANGLGQANYTQYSWHLSGITTSGAVASTIGGGRRQTTSALDGIRFYFGSGNIASGNIYLYGLKSSL